MSSSKHLKLAQRITTQQLELVGELESLSRDIERSEKTISDLKSQLDQVNVRHQHRNSTREDIAYLEDLLTCAKKKLAWEKQMASLQKRTPELLYRIKALMNDAVTPPEDQTRIAVHESLQKVQSSMERLQAAKLAGNL